MEWCGPTLSVLIFSFLVVVTQGKKVAVCLKEGLGRDDAELVAKESQYKVAKQVGETCFLFEKITNNKRAAENETETVEPLLLHNAAVREAEVSVPKIRVKRWDSGPAASLDTFVRTFHDPNFTKQWHLYNEQYMGNDLNVLPVWARNITGHGVTVAILDDGVEHTHPDIKDNYDPSTSWDFLDNDNDPSPIESQGDTEVFHGTRCAGLVTASKNNVCGVGVAYNAKIAGIRMLKNKGEDATEAEALKHCRDKIDIYSSSWGPIDDGTKIDGPGLLAKTALEEGTKFGRGGKGSIYIWASGNGGRSKDNCNCDGYCSSIYTISVSAVTDKGTVPSYVEECTAMLAATYSSGQTGTDRRILTTDLNSGCTDQLGGTSAAAPLAAGVIALALSANPNLTWRDVQHIIVQSSSYPESYSYDYRENGVGRRISDKIGFGILNSNDLVETAVTWQNVGEQHICRLFVSKDKFQQTDTTLKSGNILKVTIPTDGCAGESGEVAVLEHVQAILSITHQHRGSLKIYLESPSGTTSSLLTVRPADNNPNINRWPFLTVQMWGEPAAGDWKLYIESVGDDFSGELTFCELVLHGTVYDSNSSSQKCPNSKKSLYDPEGTGDISCVDKCPTTGYYTSQDKCYRCHSTCFTCSDYNVCTSCPDHLFLYYEKNTCIAACTEGYSIEASKLQGKICVKDDSPLPWYQGDTLYILVVALFITLLIVIVLVISVHHYRKHKIRSVPHRPLQPITASVSLPLNDVSRDGARIPTTCRVSVEIPPLRTARANSHNLPQGARNSRANSHSSVLSQEQTPR